MRSARARTLAPGEVWVYKPLLPSALRCSYSSPSISISQKSTFMFSKIDTGRGACSSVSLSQKSWPEKDVLFLWLSKFFKNFDSLSQNIVEIIACSVLLALCLKTHSCRYMFCFSGSLAQKNRQRCHVCFSGLSVSKGYSILHMFWCSVSSPSKISSEPL